MLRSPYHPGEYLREFLSEHSISQTKLARHIGVQIGVINQICKEKRGISAAMAVKLSKALSTTPELWMNLQLAYELGQQDTSLPIRSLLEKSG